MISDEDGKTEEWTGVHLTRRFSFSYRLHISSGAGKVLLSCCPVKDDTSPLTRDGCDLVAQTNLESLSPRTTST